MLLLLIHRMEGKNGLPHPDTYNTILRIQYRIIQLTLLKLMEYKLLKLATVFNTAIYILAILNIYKLFAAVFSA